MFLVLPLRMAQSSESAASSLTTSDLRRGVGGGEGLAKMISHILIENISPGRGAPFTWLSVPCGSLSTEATFLTSAPTR